MPIKYRLLGALAAAIICLGLMCVALVSQALGHGQQQQARWLLQTQAHGWQQLQTEQMQQLEHIAAQLSQAQHPATVLEIQQSMQAAVQNHSGLRMDLFDEDARLLATTAGEISPEPLLDPLSVLRWSQYLEHMQGLHQMSSHRYHWLKLTSVGPYVLVLSQDVTPVLPMLSQRLAGNFFLLNMRGTTIASTTTERIFSGQLQLPARQEQVLTLAANDPRLVQKNPLQLISQPLNAGNHNIIGSLVWSRDASLSEQDSQQFIQLVTMAILAMLVLTAGGIFLFLRHTLSPLTSSVDVLQSLAQGNTEVALYGGEEDAPDESGTVARAVMQLRSELLNLETLRQEHMRTRRQQERLIRDQLRSLAANLDAESREEILASLGTGTENTVPEESTNVLANLARILGRMSELISAQQNRLLKLLHEVQVASQIQATLASLQQELEIARKMQLSILPRKPPDSREVDIASTMVAAKEVGGDFYDYFAIDDDHLAVVVADVSGKGVPAAFFMAISRTLLKSNGLFLRNPGATISTLNNQLCTENEQMMFVTAFYAVLQLSTGLLTFVNAGHNPPILLSQGTARYFPPGRNMALAVLDDQQYHEGTLQLAAGDSLLLYTDGVTEATDANKALYGDARLLQLVQSLGSQPHSGSQAQQLTEQLVRDVRQFEAGADQSDDITVVALTYRGHTQ